MGSISVALSSVAIKISVAVLASSAVTSVAVVASAVRSSVSVAASALWSARSFSAASDAMAFISAPKASSPEATLLACASPVVRIRSVTLLVISETISARSSCLSFCSSSTCLLWLELSIVFNCSSSAACKRVG